LLTAKRFCWWGGSLLALGGLGWGAWYLATHPDWGAAPVGHVPRGITVQAKSLTICGYQQRGRRAMKVWQVTAHDVGQSADGNGQWFREITDGILYRDEQPVARFTAGKGQGDQAANSLSIQGGARMRLEADGTTLETEQVHWRGAQRQLWLPLPVRITRGDLQLQVQSARLDLLPGQLTLERVTGSQGLLQFQAGHGLLHLKDRSLELHPTALQMPAGRVTASRIVFLAEEGRFKAQEVHMQLTISPATRAAAATGLTLALLNAAAAAPAPAPEKKPRQIIVNGDELTDSGREMVLANAQLRQPDPKGDTFFTADRMQILKDEKRQAKVVIATGKPRAWNDRNEVTGEKMTVYPKEHRVVVEGNFKVVVLPKPGDEPSKDKSDLKGQVKDGVMTGDRLEYDYRTKNIAAHGNLHMQSRGRTATGQDLFYTDKTEIVEFRGPVNYRDEKGETFKTETGLQLALNKNGISHVPGKFTGTLLVPEEDESDSSASEDKNSAATPAPSATAQPTSPEKQKSGGG
jgi:lipopolysaccharide export system protein LptA